MWLLATEQAAQKLMQNVQGPFSEGEREAAAERLAFAFQKAFIDEMKRLSLKDTPR